MCKTINPNCPCPKKCKRHGNCEACRKHHIKSLPYCERKEQNAN